MPKPALTDIMQIFSLEKLTEPASKRRLSSNTYYWGDDRVVDLQKNDTSNKDQFNGTCSCFTNMNGLPGWLTNRPNGEK